MAKRKTWNDEILSSTNSMKAATHGQRQPRESKPLKEFSENGASLPVHVD